MYFYVDESGHTGPNLFDSMQPTLYYGVLSSRMNIDVVARAHIGNLRRELGVPRLHASELGEQRLNSIGQSLVRLQALFDLRFDCYRVQKEDHAVICFFDQVFDQGMNPAVPWHWYWSPLRYPLLLHVAGLFDDDLLRRSWAARIERNDGKAQAEVRAICLTLVERSGEIKDARVREVVENALGWAADHAAALNYNASSKHEVLAVCPNMVGFQSVLMGIAQRMLTSRERSKTALVTIDQQSQFNQSQKTLHEWYLRARGIPMPLGPGLPVFDVRGLPEAPVRFSGGGASPGLELVDVYLWLFRRGFERKRIPPMLAPLLKRQLTRGRTDEISLSALDRRWSAWFDQLPELTPERVEMARGILKEVEARRRADVESLNSPDA